MGERRGRPIGFLAIESVPLDPARPWKCPAVADFNADLETDDVNHLEAAGRILKGSSCYPSEEGGL
jgi:hypothetical protein